MKNLLPALLVLIGITFAASSHYASSNAVAQGIRAPIDKHDVQAIQTSLNQSVEVLQPDAQEIENLKILAGGKTDRGDYLYVCEGDLVWSIDRQEYLNRYETFSKSILWGDVSAEIAKQYTPQFKKGDLIVKVRVRARFEKAGSDLIAMSAKTIRFDLGLSSAVAKSKNK
jgi:hypothetical protein